jgi:acyl-CoA dehydrogenase
MNRDFSRYALQLHSNPGSTEKQMEFCQKMIMKPVSDKERFDRVWNEHVAALAGAYQMSD